MSVRGQDSSQLLSEQRPNLSSGLISIFSVRVQQERRQAVNDGWRYFKGDAPGAEAPSFTDAGWRELRLPHDGAIEGPFDPKFNPHTGGLPISGTGWYRKSFTVPDGLKGKFLINRSTVLRW